MEEVGITTSSDLSVPYYCIRIQILLLWLVFESTILLIFDNSTAPKPPLESTEFEWREDRAV
jgi:hypothetical protein